MKRLVLPSFIVFLFAGCIAAMATACTDELPTELESVGIFRSMVPLPNAHWLSDYFPLDPHQFGIRTYYSYAEDDYYVAMVTGTETVPYLSGPIEVTKVFLENDEIGMYSNGREFWWEVMDEDYYLSEDCNLTALPTDGAIGKVWDGLYLDFAGVEAFLVPKDGSGVCVPILPSTEPMLFKIDDIDIYGQKHANALIIWSLELEPGCYQPLTGFADEWGLTLPTREETQGNPVDGFVIFALSDGLVVLGETDVDCEGGGGNLAELEVLVSKVPVVNSSKIAFTSTRDDGDWEIYVMNADGSGQTRLTESPGFDHRPRWSPNGKKIAFWSTRDDGDWEIYVMNADGSDQTRLTDSPGGDYYPSWSPNGMKIIFDSRRDEHSEVYVMNADGSGQTNLTKNPDAYDGDSDWSPDGKKIAFWSNRDLDGEIYVMNADGSDQTRLTESPGGDQSPSWSPNGKQIVFESRRDGNWEIYVMNADGSDQTRLTDNTADDKYPRWSSNGKQIVFNSFRTGNHEVYVMNADGSGVRPLTHNTTFDGVPDWASGRGGGGGG